MMMPDPAALHEAASTYQKNFLNSRVWLPDVLKELRTAPGGGWGLNGAKITLPKMSKILATAEICSGCQGNKVFGCHECGGQGFSVCQQCQGRGWELCYNCAGRGVNPAHPNQPCAVCHGKKYAPCRYCRSTGKLVCPTCQGRRSTICPRCGGAGQFTDEVALNCGVTLNFGIKSQGFPSGLRRGLDRLGIENLIKGYADVQALPEDKEEKDKGAPDAQTPATLRFEAILPYADLKLRFGPNARAVLVGVFGKRGALMGVPPFLDESLRSWRDTLKAAAQGDMPLEKALGARTIRDALKLTVAGEGKANNLRKFYPVGLTAKTAQQILLDMRRALDRVTWHIRLAATIFGGVVGIALLLAFLRAPFHANLMAATPWPVGLLLDLAALAAVMGLGWIGLGKSVQYELKRRFPELTISLHENIGVIGSVMLGGLFAAWLAILISMPEKPTWFLHLFGGFFGG
jgi:hypothetical protein